MVSQIYKKLDGWPAIVVGVLALAGIAYFGFHTYRNIEVEKTNLLAELETAREGNYSLLQQVRERERIIDSFNAQISKISGTVGTLEKLAATDEELLKKYSKIYFLNENYAPTKLTEIDPKFIYTNSKNTQIHTDVWPHLKKLFEDAREDGVELLSASAFRSFDTQSSLKSSYVFTYGTGANTFSADQGYSEHQLGTSLDFTTPASGTALLQANDPGYKWLLENAHDYGFILSYPAGNSYYKFEPWHWRFVGRDLATDLHDAGKNFYDLDQREIDTYLIKLFD
ncbi:MAG: M15 family metallopeptidase [bacterium]|nr:M15 family metallopeptidase [bacterium]